MTTTSPPDGPAPLSTRLPLVVTPATLRRWASAKPLSRRPHAVIEPAPRCGYDLTTTSSARPQTLLHTAPRRRHDGATGLSALSHRFRQMVTLSYSTAATLSLGHPLPGVGYPTRPCPTHDTVLSSCLHLQPQPSLRPLLLGVSSTPTRHHVHARPLTPRRLLGSW